MFSRCCRSALTMLRTALCDIARGPPLLAPPIATRWSRLHAHRLRRAPGPTRSAAHAVHGKGSRQRLRKPARHPLQIDFASKAEELDDELEPVGMGLDPLDTPDNEKSETELRACRALMLDSAYRPIRVVSWQRAVCTRQRMKAAPRKRCVSCLDVARSLHIQWCPAVGSFDLLHRQACPLWTLADSRTLLHRADLHGLGGQGGRAGVLP